MSSNEYHFTSDWQVEGTVDEVSAIITDTVSLPRWWPSVYLDVTVLQPGLKDGTQKAVRLLTRGWLPYSLDWTLRVTESRHPHGLTLEAEGDFSGRGIWHFVQDGPAFSFAMIGRSEPTSHCSVLSPLRSNLSSKPTIAGPWNAEKRAFGLSWHDGVPAAQTSWPAYLRLQDRHGSLHSSCG